MGLLSLRDYEKKKKNLMCTFVCDTDTWTGGNHNSLGKHPPLPHILIYKNKLASKMRVTRDHCLYTNQYLQNENFSKQYSMQAVSSTGINKSYNITR